MNNLLEETIHELKENGKEAKDVKWVGNEDIWFKWADFERVANVEYSSGYGSVYVPVDLKVVGINWWLERIECEGAEWWEFKVLPLKPNRYFAPGNLLNNMFKEYNLSDLIKYDKENKKGDGKE